MKKSCVVPVLLAAVLAGCEDPVAPMPIAPEQIELELRDIYTYENGVPVEQVVEFAVVTAPQAPVDSIAELEVVWPNGVVRMPVPTEFHGRTDGQQATSMRVPRERGLFDGVYRLVVRFVDGREVTIERSYITSWRLGPAMGITLEQYPDWIYVEWRAPTLPHEWRIRLERREPLPVDTVFDGLDGLGRGGSLGAGFDFTAEAGVLYAFVLELESRHTIRRYAYLFRGE